MNATKLWLSASQPKPVNVFGFLLVMAEHQDITEAAVGDDEEETEVTSEENEPAGKYSADRKVTSIYFNDKGFSTPWEGKDWLVT
eukprot:gene20855-22900_t